MTESENKTIELVTELQTLDQQIVDARNKLSKERARLTELESDNTMAAGKLAAAIKKSKDLIEVHEQTIVIVEQRKLPFLQQVRPLLKALANEHRIRESDAKNQNVEQARAFVDSPEVKQAMSLVAAAFWHYKNARGAAGFGWDDLFNDSDEIERLCAEQPAFKTVSESDAQQQLRAWSHQADMAAQQNAPDTPDKLFSGRGFG